MKQFQFDYKGKTSLDENLQKIEKWCQKHTFSNIVFQIYSDIDKTSEIDNICKYIIEIIPDALCMSCSTNGNIIDGCYTISKITIVCIIFEKPSTKVKLLHYDYDGTNIDEITDNIIKVLDNNKWVKAIEFNVTILGQSMTKFCNNMSSVNKEIHIFGGGAFNFEGNPSKAYVYSEKQGFSDNGFVLLLMGGEDFNVQSKYISGWKPLGKKFTATRTKDNILYEFDNEPAYNVYHKYLNIKNDEHLFDNTHEFPFVCKRNGVNLLHVPVYGNTDGSLVLTSTINEGDVARITYGDPVSILETIYSESKEIEEFAPDIIHIFSCSARKSFWGENSISKETSLFQNIAQTSGFFTAGEFLRTGENLCHHNVTLVISAMREGEPDKDKIHSVPEFRIDGKISILGRLAHFIEATTSELEDLNHKLEYASVTDGLTGLYNRAEMQRRIEKALEDNEYPFCLIMLDIDNFKKVNDTYGHQCGDEVIKTLSSVMQNILKKYSPDASAGRWGGEEFMIFIPDTILIEAKKIAEKIRIVFENYIYYNMNSQTTSIGVTQAKYCECVDDLCTRVDKALYQAKTTGKNKTIII